MQQNSTPLNSVNVGVLTLDYTSVLKWKDILRKSMNLQIQEDSADLFCGVFLRS